MSFFTAVQIADGVTPSIIATVKAASTAAVAADPALVVSLSPNSGARMQDGAGNALTSNSTVTAAKFALDQNIISILGTAPTTAGFLDIKGADGNIFVRQATAANLNATVVGTGTFVVQATLNPETTKVIGTIRMLGNAGAILDAVTTAASTPANGVATLVANVTTPPSLTTGQSVAMQADYVGSQFVKPYRRSQTVVQATTIASSSAATPVLAAQAAGIFADISNLIITVTPAAGAVTNIPFTATLSDGTNSYIFDLDTGATGSATVSGSGPTNLVATFNPPIPASTAATAWQLTLSVNTVTVHVTTVAVLQKAS